MSRVVCVLYQKKNLYKTLKKAPITLPLFFLNSMVPPALVFALHITQHPSIKCFENATSAQFSGCYRPQVTVIRSGEIIDTLVEYVQIETKTDDVSMTEF